MLSLILLPFIDLSNIHDSQISKGNISLFPGKVYYQSACSLRAQGQQAGHVWGEVQALQGSQVYHQGWEVPDQNVNFPFIPLYFFHLLLFCI